MLKLYTDRVYLPPDSRHLPIFFPFWGVQTKRTQAPEVFEKYVRQAPQMFELVTDVGQADLVLLPAEWPLYTSKHEVDSAQKLVTLAERAGKPLVTFTTGDGETTPPFKTTHLRPSVLKSKEKGDVFASPAWARDLLAGQALDDRIIRHQGAKPVVGFCGFGGWGLRQELRFVRRLWWRIRAGRDLADESTHGQPRFLRQRALKLLDRSPLVETNFLVRDTGYGRLRAHTPDQTQRLALVDTYADNVLGSDYTLCVRGVGNYSYRFYETLSAGRIPVFVNTDCALPFEWIIPWKNYCVWVEDSEVAHIAEKVADFHGRLSPEAFVDLQRECRRLWDDWVSPEGFFGKFHLHFPQFAGQTDGGLRAAVA